MAVSRWAVLLLALVVGAAACGRSVDEADASRPTVATTVKVTTGVPTETGGTSGSTSAQPSTTEPASVEPTATEPAGSESASSSTRATTTAATDATEATVAPIVIRLRLDRRVDDRATEGFASFVEEVLTDGRGWTRAGFEFIFDETDFDYTVVLAEGPEVDSLCLPYDTFGRFSCQIGPTVALNADRWRSAVDEWPATLDDYRTMLVNHEVGHLLGQHHPASRCPGDGQPAPVMVQQSSGVAPCMANPWPLGWEITCAQQGVEPLAPPYEEDITLTCGPNGPVD